MLSALLYLQFRSLTNHFLLRARRLRQPRYLLGALFGGGYLLLMVSRSFLPLLHGGRRAAPALFPGLTPATWEFIFGLVLAAGAVLAWVVPHQRAALVFTEAEIAFLFPAPITRRTLVLFKLVRSQVAVLFTVFFLTIIFRSANGLEGALLRAAGWWIILSTINLHLLGCSFARTILLDRGLTLWRRRLLVLALVGALGAVAVYWVRAAVPLPGDEAWQSPAALGFYVNRVAHSAPAVWLLAPFRAVVRPFVFSDQPPQFLRALGTALGILLLHFLWVVQSDVAFEEASLESSRRHATRLASLREGKGLHARPAKRRRAPFRLAPTGPPAVAILWKNLLGAGQFFNVRLAVTVLAWAVALGIVLTAGAGRTHWPQVIGFACVMITAWTLLLGPQIVRQDFRQDLAVADLLKGYPLHGWQVALGEVLTPALILTVIQGALILLAATLLGGGGNPLETDDGYARLDEHPASILLGNLWHAPVLVGLAAAFVLPPFNVVGLLMPNAAALLLPAWFANTQPGGPRGIEVMGQRLIFFLAQFVALALASLPAGLAVFLVYALAIHPHLEGAAALPICALAAAGVFTAEAAGGIALLGYWFERYDLTAEKSA